MEQHHISQPYRSACLHAQIICTEASDNAISLCTAVAATILLEHRTNIIRRCVALWFCLASVRTPQCCCCGLLHPIPCLNACTPVCGLTTHMFRQAILHSNVALYKHYKQIPPWQAASLSESNVHSIWLSLTSLLRPQQACANPCMTKCTPLEHHYPHLAVSDILQMQ